MPTLSDEFVLAAAGLLYDAQTEIDKAMARKRINFIDTDYPADMSILNAELDRIILDELEPPC